MNNLILIVVGMFIEHAQGDTKAKISTKSVHKNGVTSINCL